MRSRDLAAMKADILPSQVVGQKQHDIGCRGGTRGLFEEEQRERNEKAAATCHESHPEHGFESLRELGRGGTSPPRRSYATELPPPMTPRSGRCSVASFGLVQREIAVVDLEAECRDRGRIDPSAIGPPFATRLPTPGEGTSL